MSRQGVSNLWKPEQTPLPPNTDATGVIMPSVSFDPSAQQLVGQAMVRTGAAILMVPDPLPLVDEVVGGALVVGGAILTMAD